MNLKMSTRGQMAKNKSFGICHMFTECLLPSILIGKRIVLPFGFSIIALLPLLANAEALRPSSKRLDQKPFFKMIGWFPVSQKRMPFACKPSMTALPDPKIMLALLN